VSEEKLVTYNDKIMHRVQFTIEKQPPVTNGGSSENLELFHGIGNKLGFNITGGSDFNMPITIFHVSQSSAATHISSLSLFAAVCHE
jgi:hypothetical protein